MPQKEKLAAAAIAKLKEPRRLNPVPRAIPGESKPTAIPPAQIRKPFEQMKPMADAKIPGPEGANYVSRNDLHVVEGAASGVTHSAERVPYKKAASEVGADLVEPPKRELNPVERLRQKNNRTRDQRTNLGRGKSAVPEID